jgi:hypothetical protein
MWKQVLSIGAVVIAVGVLVGMALLFYQYGRGPVVLFVIGGQHIAQENKAQQQELRELQAQVDEDQIMLDRLLNQLWQSERDIDLLLVRAWFIICANNDLPIEFKKSTGKLQFPPYRSIFLPYTPGKCLESM